MATHPLTRFSRAGRSCALPTSRHSRLSESCALLMALQPFLGSVGGPADGQPDKNRTPAGMYAHAGRLYGARKYQEALSAYREYLDTVPDVKPVTRGMVEQRVGLCLRYLGQHEEALAQLGRIVASHRDQLVWWSTQIYRGEVLLALKRFGEAEQAVAAGLMTSKLPSSMMGQAYRVLVTVRLQQNDPQAALAYAKRMFQVTALHGLVDAINCVCECHKRIDGDIDPNVREFLEFQRFGPNGPDGKAKTEDDLTTPLDRVTTPDEAELAAFAREAIPETEPRDPTSRGRLWMLAGEYHQALREFLNAYRAAPLETTKSRWPRRMTEAAGDIATALKAIDGHVHRANRYLLYQRRGPAGEDGKPGTEDDLTDPLRELPKDYWDAHAPPDPRVDAAFQAALDEQPNTYEGYRARGYLDLAWGRCEKGAEEMREAYKHCPLTQRGLVQAITDVAVAIKAQDGDIARANQYLLFKKHGPKGKDGKPGTEDDLRDPLATER